MAEVRKVMDRQEPGRGAVVEAKVKTIIVPTIVWESDRKEVRHTTAVEDIRKLPEGDLAEVIQITQEAIADPTTATNEQAYWNTLALVCMVAHLPHRVGKSWGDPHLNSFDGYAYDLQSVGEFVLTRSTDGLFEVQTRQVMVSDKVSMNGACAINMMGDRISVEAAPLPTPFNQVIRVNGEEVDFRKEYVTPRGIVISKGDDHDIVVRSPLGDKVMITPLSNGKYMAVVPAIVKRDSVSFEGLLGNADGDPRNDLGPMEKAIPASLELSAKEELEKDKEHAKSLTKTEQVNLSNPALNFGHQWRLTDENSLFTYDGSKNTAYYTDLSYPRQHASHDDHDEAELERARRTCADAGVAAVDMEGCMTDVLLIGAPSATEHALAVQDERVMLKLDLPPPVVKTSTHPVLKEPSSAIKVPVPSVQESRTDRPSLISRIGAALMNPSTTPTPQESKPAPHGSGRKGTTQPAPAKKKTEPAPLPPPAPNAPAPKPAPEPKPEPKKR